MTTKLKTAVASVSTAIAAAAASIAPKAKPTTLTLVGPVHTTLHKLTAAARQGYLATNLEMYGSTGQMFVTLELGCPDPAVVDAIETDMAEALAIQEAAQQRAIEAAAEHLVAERERAARKAEHDAKVSAAEAALAALKAEAA